MGELEDEKRELQRKLEAQKEKYKRLWNRYRRYHNPHTPSSKRLGGSKSKRSRKRGKAASEDNKRKKKPGRKPGHKPAWRERPEPDDTIEVPKEKCDHCGAELGEPFRQESRVITDLPDPEPLQIIEFKLGHYKCPSCGEENVAEHPDCPDRGDYGPNAMVQTSLFKYEQRLPHRKVSELLERLYGLKISAATVLNITERVADQLRPLYREIGENIREANVINGDETGFKIGGKRGWLWDFSTGEEVLYAVRRSRGSGVLEEVLGNEFDGWIVCDGLRSYATFTSKLQRCWAHLLREANDVADRHEEAEPIAKDLNQMYNDLITFLQNDPPPEEREIVRDWAMAAMRSLTEKESENDEVADLIGKIRNGMKHWFTFVVEPEVPPTNNAAENDLKEPIVIRKIIGTLRNEKGMYIL
ncbi:hypothetical protein AKJ43_01305, partial [candidate division MSBL1 archaeon SCGC-AAA261D19]